MSSVPADLFMAHDEAGQPADVPGGISGPISMWEQRNGRVDVRPVTHAQGAVLYTTKQAALSGEVVLSDTLRPYRQRLTDRPRVALYSPIEARR